MSKPASKRSVGDAEPTDHDRGDAGRSRVFRARWVIPVSRPPIRDGWVEAVGHRIVAVGQADQSPPSAPLIELGDAAILPGLVNAHTHLEFSELSRPIGEPGIELDRWVVEVIAARGRTADAAGPTDAAGGGGTAGSVIAAGSRQAMLGGARMVYEIATTPWDGFAQPLATATVAFAEVLGLDPRRADERFTAARNHLARVDGSGTAATELAAGISPHAPYSTTLETVRRCVELARERRLPVAMHVAESGAERELIERGSGRFAATLRDLGLYRPDHFGLGEGATAGLLQLLAEAPYALIVHGHDLRDEEADLIAGDRRMTLVYCPRTADFFGHVPGGFAAVRDRGGRVALGTDSRASNPDLSLWNEVLWLLDRRPDIAWHEVLAMATVGGADAIGRGDLGRIEPGARSGLIAVPGDCDRSDDLPDVWIRSGAQPRFLSSGIYTSRITTSETQGTP